RRCAATALHGHLRVAAGAARRPVLARLADRAVLPLVAQLRAGGGSRLSLAQGGEVRLLGYSESSGDGQPSICATPDASLRTRAEQWLAPIDARVESAACEDPGMLRLARTTESGEAHV